MAMEATEYAFPFDAEECEGGYDREYIADDFARYFRAFITSGIIADGGNIAESLQVIANDDMTTTLKKGNLIIDGYRYELTDDMIFHHTAADGVLDRIDRISVTLDTAEREIHAIVREGEYSYKPVAPQCRRNSEFLDYVVADVRVVAGSIKIVQANITDTRLSTELCGVAYPFWKLDTQAFFVQLNSFYNEFVAKSDNSYKQFQDWQEDKKEEITTWQAEEEKQTDDWQKKETDDFTVWAEEFVNKWESWLLGETKGWQEEIIDWFNNLKEQLTENAAVSLQEQIGNLNHLETETKENLVSAINDLCLSYDETMEILAGVETVTVTLSAYDGSDVTGQSVILYDSTAGRETSYEYSGTVTLKVISDHSYYITATDNGNYLTPRTESFIAVEGNKRTVSLIYEKLALDSLTWAQIAAYAESGKAEQIFGIGDTKDFTLTTGEKLKAVIMDFNHDQLASDTSKRAGITFGMLSCLATAYQMNSSDTNVGGYDGSKLFTTVNTEFYDKLPDDMKPYVKKVRKKASKGNNSSTIKEFDAYAFLLAEIEVFNTTERSYPGEGTMYPYFATAANRIKTLDISGSADNWWLRSPRSGNTTSFCIVYRDGTLSISNASIARWLSAGFCM